MVFRCFLSTGMNHPLRYKECLQPSLLSSMSLRRYAVNAVAEKPTTLVKPKLEDGEEEGGNKTSKFLRERYPSLFKELIPSDKYPFQHEDVTIDCGIKVKWKCETCTFTFERSVIERALLTKECPQCLESGKKLLVNIDPEISAEWNPLRNHYTTSPAFLETTSKSKIWWKCKDCQHEWAATPKTRMADRSCPKCNPANGKWLMRHPDIAKEWHPLRNGDLTAYDIKWDKMKRPYWWLCSSCGSEWQAGVQERISKSNECPTCGPKS
eukprot:PhF_6_TR13197/c0_g1_i1/m.20843